MPAALLTVNSRNGFVSAFDRRKDLRGRVRWQVRFLTDTGSFVTATENLSSGGFYCLSPVPLQIGHLGSCVLEVPTHRARQNLLLKCTVRVLRVERLDDAGICGVGCRIEDYSVLHNTREPPTPTVSGAAS
jgi:hypothetical protein